MIKLSLGARMCREQETPGSRLIWELSAALKCQGTQNNESGFVVVTYLYEHILTGVCVCIIQGRCIYEPMYTNLKVKICGF